MSDLEPIEFHAPRQSGFQGGGAVEPEQVCFDRKELNLILRLYGLQVAAGEWRDYAIDTLHDRAVFSVFRRSSEIPLYRIEKNPKLARKQGVYAVIAAGGHILKRGRDLEQVLRSLQPKPRVAVF